MAADVEIVINARDNYSGVLGNFGNIITGINSLVNLAGDAFRTFGDFALQGLDAIAGYERMGASLQSLVASQLLMNGAAVDMASAMEVAGVKAEDLLKWIQDLAINSPFTAEGVALAFRQAMAYGFSAEEAQRLTEAMINFSAGTGATEDSMSRIAAALGQIEAKGHLSGQEVLQLVNAGLAVDQILADAFGKSTEEIVKMREAGLIPADDAIRAITEYMETNFAGAAENQAKTWAGLMGTFADLKNMGLREFFGGIAEVLQPLAADFSDWLQSEGMTRLKEIGQDLGDLTADFIEFASQLQGLQGLSFSQLTQRFEEWTQSIDWEKISQGLAEGIKNINWEVVGNEVRLGLKNILEGLDTVVDEVDWNALGVALGDAWSDLLTGMLNLSEFQYKMDNFFNDFSYELRTGFQNSIFSAFSISDIRYRLDNFLNSFSYELTAGWNDAMARFKTSAIAGVIDFANDFINAIKAMFGISSPSTVFFNIASDIAAGFLEGLNALGNLLGGGTSAAGLGTAGGGTAGGTTTGGLSSGSVVNNYYGPVYFGAAGEPGAYYDCPSPHPLVASSGNQLVTTGF